MKKNTLICLCILFLVSACVKIPNIKQRQATASQLIATKNWQPLILQTSTFNLQSFIPKKLQQTDHLSIYIEGDGFAWVTKSTVSNNPTPINPLTLKLALADPNDNAVYLARPCQYINSQTSVKCRKQYWTSHRFSAEIIQATDQAISQLKQRYRAKNLTLIGYSGGGAVATLIAEQRQDVIKLITVAGNLDHQFWTKHHRISPLNGSLNPTNLAKNLTFVEQTHFVGKNDKVMPPSVARSFSQFLSNPKDANIRIIANTTHYCCWDSLWQKLLQSTQRLNQ